MAGSADGYRADVPRPRVLVIVGLGLALAVLAYSVLAPSALPRLVEQRRDNDALAGDLARQQDENAQQERELVLLKDPGADGARALEQAARSELGFVGKDEVVFVGLPTPEVGSGAAEHPPEQQEAQ